MKSFDSKNVNSSNLTRTFLVLLLLTIFACKESEVEPVIPDNVERISLVLDYEAGFGGYVYPVYNPYVFFRDNMVVKEPKVPIEELNLEALTTDQASRWGTWTQSGELFNITWSNGSTSEKSTSQIHPAYPALKGEALNGYYASFEGGGNIAFGGSVGIVALSSFTFTADGRFTNEKLGGGSSSNSAAFNKQNTAGTYILDDYAIELLYNSGDSKKLFFCFYSSAEDRQLEPDEIVFRIAGRAYVSR